MFTRKIKVQERSMPTAEAFASWGAYELSFEELLEVNGGRHVIDDPSTDDISDTIANGGSSPGGSSSSSNSGSSSDGSSGSTGGSSGNSDSSGGSSGTNDSSPPASSSPSEPVTGSDSDDTGGGYTDYWEGACTDWYESGGSSGGGSSNGSSESSDNHSSDSGNADSGSSDDSWGGSSDNDSSDSGGSYSGSSYTGGGYTYTPPAQNQEPSASSNPGAQGQKLPNTGGAASVSPVQKESDITQQVPNTQSPVPQVPATAEKKKSEGLWNWGKRKLDSIGQGIVAGMNSQLRMFSELTGIRMVQNGKKDGAGEWRNGLAGQEKNGLAGIHNKADELLENEIKEKTSDNIMKFPIDMSKVTSIDEYGPRERMEIKGKKTDPFHGGMDIAAPEGTPILAAIDGWVREISFNESSYGNYIVIGNDKGWTGTLTYYGHLKEAPSLVLGEPVKQGQQIGLVGSTGLSSGPHVHFEVRTNYGHTKHDPRGFLLF